MESKKKDKEVTVYTSDLEMSGAGRGVWLVKVPKYISSRWEKIKDTETAGTLHVTKIAGQKPQVKLSLSDQVMKLAGEEDVPKEHSLLVSGIASQTLGVLSQITTPSSLNSPLETEKLIFEGKVTQKLECRPTASASYMKLKRDSIFKAQQPTRTVKQLDRVIQTYKPVSDHKHNIEFEERKKAEGKKARDDKSKVMDMLFAAFEKHQYYNIKDLVKITNQPVTYLKEILKDVCVYNLKNPHKNMWELKPEYRCYEKKDDDD